MQSHDFHDDDIIDLGQVSAETKGQAVFEIDGSNGKLNYLSGIVDE